MAALILLGSLSACTSGNGSREARQGSGQEVGTAGTADDGGEEPANDTTARPTNGTASATCDQWVRDQLILLERMLAAAAQYSAADMEARLGAGQIPQEVVDLVEAAETESPEGCAGSSWAIGENVEALREGAPATGTGAEPLHARMLADAENRLVRSLLRDALVVAITYEQEHGRSAESATQLLELSYEGTAVLARALEMARTELTIVGYDFSSYDYCLQAEASTGEVFSLHADGTERSGPCP